MILLIALLPAGLLGFTAHSASICAVKAVSEVITTHRSHMLNSFGKTAMWILTVMMLLIVLAPSSLMPTLRAPNLISIFGAFLFGVGAALNGGCAISTVTHLGNGEFRMALTIAGIVLAIAAFDGGLLALPVMARQTLNPFVLGYWELRFAIVLLLGWAIHETITLWRKRDLSCGLIEGLLHRPWRLSTAAAVIGLTNVAIAVRARHSRDRACSRHLQPCVLFARQFRQ
jgi:uncharacterized membrane protein YedE/YeeE